jgi:CDP-diacylglycerol--glycerol-3-phosphate 3-phosphatidyltransferase
MAKTKLRPSAPKPITAPGDNIVWNVPNILTAVRLILAILVFVLIPYEQFGIAVVIFAIAASTDWIDGYWARKYGQVTKLGRIFDPFVDKIIICGTFIYLAAEYARGSGIWPWMAVVVVGRELLVTALRSAIEGKGGDFSAKYLAKWKMLFQCAAVVASLVALRYFHQHPDATVLPQWLSFSLVVSVWVAMILTVYTGLEYVFIAARALRS